MEKTGGSQNHKWEKREKQELSEDGSGPVIHGTKEKESEESEEVVDEVAGGDDFHV